MTTRMTAQRLGRLIAAGDLEAVRSAVGSSPRVLAGTLERSGHGGWTPLHVAVAEGQAEVVRLLVAAGADLEARTEHGRTPLHVALERRPDLVPVLLGLGAVVDAASAAFLDDVATLTARLEDGTALEAAAPDSDLLRWAARGGAADAARLLLARGADADGGALHAAAGGARPDLVRLLLDAGADVDRREPGTGRAPLHAAVAAGPEAAETVRVLLEAGADVDATTSDGASALDISRVAAARHRHADADRAPDHDALVELLVAHGASH